MANASEYIRQAAAIPLRDGAVCLITSSNGKRWVIPKGLIDPGHTAGESALLEAWEEAGLLGVLQPEPVGSYLYSKYGQTYHVTVFLLQVTEAKAEWPEDQVRQRAWLNVAQALERIDDVGLREVVRGAVKSG